MLIDKLQTQGGGTEQGSEPRKSLLDAVRTHVLAILTNRAVIGSLAGLAIKVAGSVLGIVMFTLAARSMGAEEFGHLAVWFNAMSFMAVATVFGQDTLIARSWGEYIGQGLTGFGRGAYRFGWFVSGGVALVAAIGVVTAEELFDFGVTPSIALAAAAFLVAQTLLHYSSHSTRVIAGLLQAEPCRELVWRIATIGTILAFGLLHGQMRIEAFFLSAAAGMAVGVLVQLFLVNRRFPEDVRAAVPAFETRPWLQRGTSMWFSAVLEAASQYLEVLVIGLVTTPLAAGAYFVAGRIANVFPMISSGLNGYSASRISALHYAGRHDDLQRMMRTIMMVALLLVGSLALVVVLFGKWILGIFGADYVSAYPTLIVLALGTALATLVGPASFLLLTTGHERLYPRVMAGGLALRLTLLAALVPLYGSLGAAVAWTISALPTSVALVMLCRSRVGVDPSILSLVPGLSPQRSR